MASRNLISRYGIHTSLLTRSSQKSLGSIPNAGRLLLAYRNNTVQTRGVKTSTVDWKPIRQKESEPKGSGFARKMFLGLLCLMPVVSFGLGTWQVQRLRWKTDLISEAEDRLSLPPLELPNVLNPEVASSHEFDYRRVLVRGKFRHDQEMYVGPRMRDGKEGVIVMTPLERPNGGSKLLINRGWISKDHLRQSTRPLSLPQEEVEIECLLRKTPEKGMFTPEPAARDSPMYHFMDVVDMAKKTGCQPILLEELLDPDLGKKANEIQGESLSVEQMERHGIPIGSLGKVTFRNTHFQYILTWYGLSIFTTFMLYSLLKTKKAPKSNLVRKIEHARQNNF